MIQLQVRAADGASTRVRSREKKGLGGSFFALGFGNPPPAVLCEGVVKTSARTTNLSSSCSQGYAKCQNVLFRFSFSCQASTFRFSCRVSMFYFVFFCFFCLLCFVLFCFEKMRQGVASAVYIGNLYMYTYVPGRINTPSAVVFLYSVSCVSDVVHPPPAATRTNFWGSRRPYRGLLFASHVYTLTPI